MLPAQKIAYEHEEDLKAERLELQAECLKRMLLADGVVDIGGFGETMNYTIEDAITDWCDDGLFKLLGFLAMNRDSDLNRHQGLNKLLNSLEETIDKAMTFHAKELLERSHEQQ